MAELRRILREAQLAVQLDGDALLRAAVRAAVDPAERKQMTYPFVRRGDAHGRSERVARDPFAAEVPHQHFAEPAAERVAVLVVGREALGQIVHVAKLVLAERQADAGLPKHADEVFGRVAEVGRAGLAEDVAKYSLYQTHWISALPR